MANCSAAPCPFVANEIPALAAGFPQLRTYLDRLQAGPSCARAFA